MNYLQIGKKAFMKKYFALLVISCVLGIGLTSCEGDGPVTYHYTVENQSGVPIQLRIYSLDQERGQVTPTTYIDLDDGQKIEKKEKMYPPSIHYNFIEFFRPKQGTPNTMEVVYNKQKKTVFFEQRYTNVFENTCEDAFGREVVCNPRNLFNTFIYKNIDEHYIFTAEDYQQAEDCKGDCK